MDTLEGLDMNQGVTGSPWNVHQGRLCLDLMHKQQGESSWEVAEGAMSGCEREVTEAVAARTDRDNSRLMFAGKDRKAGYR